MRERLARLIENSGYLDVYNPEHCLLAADELIANGVIAPPCKVGQTVYCIRYDKARKPFVKPLVVLSVTMWGKGAFTVFTTKEDTVEKTVFLTREEAEEALEKMKGGEDNA